MAGWKHYALSKSGSAKKTILYHEHSHLEPSPWSPHGSDEGPAVLFGVITLDSPQTLLSVVASYNIRQTCCHYVGHWENTGSRAHRSLRSTLANNNFDSTKSKSNFWLNLCHYHVTIQTTNVVTPDGWTCQKYKESINLVPTCCNEFSIQGCSAQAGACIMHGWQRLLLQILRLGLKAEALHQAGGGRRRGLRAVATVQEDHTQHTIQHCQAKVGVVWREFDFNEQHQEKLYLKLNARVHLFKEDLSIQGVDNVVSQTFLEVFFSLLTLVF